MARLGILGGTFDPIHQGHLDMAQAAMAAASLDEVRFIMNAHPPHRNQPIATPADRTKMLTLALAPYPTFIADNIEEDDTIPHYTIDTLDTLQTRYPKANLFFIAGADSIASLPQWHEYNRLIETYQFIALNRPGVSRPNQSPHIIHVNMPDNPSSSTAIRAALADPQKKNFNTLPASVLAYIHDHSLYKGAT